METAFEISNALHSVSLLYQEEFGRIALVVVLALAVACGALSPLVVLKQRSYLGDTLTHLIFPGVTLGWILARGFDWPLWSVLVPAASLTALLGAGLMEKLQSLFRMPPDATGVAVLGGFFSTGLLILSRQKSLGLSAEHILFGDPLTLSWSDAALSLGVAAVSLGVVWGLRNHWNAWLSDAEFGSLAGYRIRTLNALFPVLLTALVLVGIFAVGGMMMAALLTIPSLLKRPRDVFSPPVLVTSVLLNVFGLIIAFAGDLPVGASLVVVGFGAVLIKACAIIIKG